MMFARRRKAENSQQSAPVVLRSAEGAVLQHLSPEIVHSIRHMLTELSYNDGIPSRVAMISAIKGEGVTYTSLALAATLAADTASSVCLVELNWYTPGLLQLISAKRALPQGKKRAKGGSDTPADTPARNGPGLAEVLAGGATFDEALIRTSQPNLTLLPAGSITIERRPFVARSAELKAAIDALGQRFDHLILDIPAVLATSDAIALASLGNGCCVVIRQGVTSANDVKRALDDVKHLRMLGVVLNQASVQTPRWLLNLIPQE